MERAYYVDETKIGESSNESESIENSVLRGRPGNKESNSISMLLFVSAVFYLAESRS